MRFEVLIFFRPHEGPIVQGVCGCEKLDEEFMVQIVAQKGPLAVNVDAVLWHDYIGEVFFDKSRILQISLLLLSGEFRQIN